MRVHRNRNQQTASGNKLNDVCSYNLLIVGLLTTKLGTLMNDDESTSNLQVCKQQQRALGNKNL